MPSLQNAFAEAEDDESQVPDHADIEQGGQPTDTTADEAPTQTEETSEAPQEDERLAEGGQTQEEEAEPQAETPEDKRAKRTAKERREARKKHLRLLEDQNALLLQQNQQMMTELRSLKGGTLETRYQLVDGRLNECLNEMEQADRLWLAAHAANNGADMQAAQRIKDEARARAGNLELEKSRLANELTQQRNQPPPQLPVPGGFEIQQHAARFRADKPWIQYGPGNRPLNQETAAATMIDAALKAEGRLSERDPAYWTELDRRLKAALPQMFPRATDLEVDDDEEDDEPPPPRERPAQPASNQRPQARKGPQVGGSGRNGGSNTNSRQVPAEVVQAIKEAGFWEDPKERADALKYYGY